MSWKHEVKDTVYLNMTRNGINATPSPRSCDGPRTSQGWGITCYIKRGCALTPPRNGEVLSIRDAKFAWYKKCKFFAEEYCQMDSVASLRTQDTVSRIWYSTVPKRVLHKPDHGKIGPDWKPVNWVQQGKIRG
jgi:hypothetical protein